MLQQKAVDCKKKTIFDVSNFQIPEMAKYIKIKFERFVAKCVYVNQR